MAQSVWRWAAGWTIGILGFDSRRGGGNFSLHHRVWSGSGARPVSYPMGAGGLSFLGVGLPGREDDHSHPSGAEFKACVELYLHSPIPLHDVVLS
jgi:hypothetical protein